MPLLDVQNLSVTFGSFRAVSNVSLAIEPGEVLGIVGESGSGKSTTALAVMRLVQHTAHREERPEDQNSIRRVCHGQRGGQRGHRVGVGADHGLGLRGRARLGALHHGVRWRGGRARPGHRGRAGLASGKQQICFLLALGIQRPIR